MRLAPVRPAAVLLLTLTTGCAEADPAEEWGLEYTSPTYGYTVSYPDSMDLREFTPADVAIGYAAGDGFDVRIELAVESGVADGGFDEFVRERARLACAGEGPGISIRCTDVTSRGPLKSEGGLKGEILDLVLERAETPGGPAVERAPRGPFVAFDLTEPGDSLARVLFVRSPATLDPWHANEQVVLSIARSLERREAE
jgi:hypothetical protein